MTLLIIYFSVALGISFLCSLLEAVILSVSMAHINLMLKKKKPGAQLLKTLKTDIDKSLAAILTLNTISHTAGASGVGAQVLKVYGEEWVALSSAILTILILVLSEVIPKSIGAAKWKSLTGFSAYGIQGLIIVSYPFVIVLKWISKMLASKNPDHKSMTREEMIMAAEMGVQEGILAEKEQRIIKNLLRLNAILAEDVMTPRSVIYTLQKDLTVDEVLETKGPIFFSRLPVYDKDMDDIIGMVLRFKIIEASSEDQHDLKIEKLVLPIHSVSETEPVANILDEFVKRREHLFVVTDEHGGTAGIITLEDVIETLLGVEIVDEFDSVEDMRKFALDQWENRKKSRKYQHVGRTPPPAAE